MTVKNINVLFLGDSGVGKTSFICRVISKTFPDKPDPTEVSIDEFDVEQRVEEQTVHAQLREFGGKKYLLCFSRSGINN
jgi:GTPase SAR1 family protein